MGKHTDTTRPVDAPVAQAPTWQPVSMGDLGAIMAALTAQQDAWSGDPDTDRYWAHNND